MIIPTPPRATPPAKIVGRGTQTWAEADSSCESITASSPIDLQSTRVEVGQIPSYPGTTARVTMAYSGQPPSDETVLWSLLASNASHKTVQLGYKTLNGEKIAHFWYVWGEGMQHNMSWLVNDRIPGKVVLYMPHQALVELGDQWSWSSVLNIDGMDVDSC
ncbi:hypothetical protein [Mycobacterium ostraviense]|uniref:Uncharacterized protein n=1 Tax=Mycobacterium ostraviense TaxID=2738409 RepID=A0A164AJZ8_9MYCO|nr:hypothetical protein [Mycobacterium ostraviense]KZS62559.1 hypothetical protein A4G28_08290 [Mycobacterium ostraviense]UGT92343.1 hypothetical protein LTS72_02625 [Mycobacterium ostraviense]